MSTKFNMCANLEKLRIEKSLCGCALKTACLIIGIIQMIALPFQFVKEGIPENDSFPIHTDSTQLTIHIIITIICMIAAGCLLWGTHKDDERFILPWLILQGLEIIFYLFASIVLFVFIFLTINVVAFVAYFFASLIGLVFGCYCWICVWSHYRNLQESNTRNEGYVPPGAALPT